MAIAAHDNQVCIHVGRMGQQGAGDVCPSAYKARQMSLDTVPSQMAHHGAVTPVSVASDVADSHNLDALGHHQQWQRICDSASSGTSLVPGDEDRPELC